MYFAQITKERIKNLCKEKNISMESMLADCSLGVNAIRQINDTKGMASFSLAKIADYLDVTVDYLLGRTDTPNAFIKTTTGYVVKAEQNNNSGNNIINQSPAQSSSGADELSEELLKKFKNLSFDEKIEVFNYIKNIKEN